MEDHKLIMNEVFFKSIIDYLKDGGHYIFPSANKHFIKKDHCLVGDYSSLESVKPLVRENFYNCYFKLQQDGKTNDSKTNDNSDL